MNDLVNVALRHPEKSAQFFLGKSLSRPEQTDGVHLVIAENGKVATFPVLAVQFRKSRMTVVLSVACPLQIIGKIVSFVSVLMVYRSSIKWFRPKKCFSNKRVNASPPSDVKVYGRIPLFWLGIKDSLRRLVGAPVLVADRVRQFKDSAMRGYAVKWLSRYRTPFLCNCFMVHKQEL